SSLAAAPFGSRTITASTFLTVASSPRPTILPSPNATFPAISTTLDPHPPPTFVDTYAPPPASSSGTKAGSIAGWSAAVAVVGLGIGYFLARRSSLSRSHRGRSRHRPRIAVLPPGSASGGARRPQSTGAARPPGARAPRPPVEGRKTAARPSPQLGRDGRPRRPRPLRARPRDEPE